MKGVKIRGVVEDLLLFPDATVRTTVDFAGVEVPVEGKVSTRDLPKLLAILGDKERARRIFGDGLWTFWPFMGRAYDESLASKIAKYNAVAVREGYVYRIFSKRGGALGIIHKAKHTWETNLIWHMERLGILRRMKGDVLVPTSEIGAVVLRNLASLSPQRAVSLYRAQTVEEFRHRVLCWLL
ncbi:MAG: hypothetical protein QW356_06980 [Candidatus Hadarchaeales archaeon]